jgi:6-pyruvoyltetrahydropterin/6-carboxytetrahydropterin synthase
MRMTLSQRFTFDAAHTLDRGEASQRVHGHTYFGEVSVVGVPSAETGMLVDLDELRNLVEGVRDALDHRLLDDVEDLGVATLENLCAFVARRLGRYPCLSSVRIWRADGGSCRLEVGA